MTSILKSNRNLHLFTNGKSYWIQKGLKPIIRSTKGRKKDHKTFDLVFDMLALSRKEIKPNRSTASRALSIVETSFKDTVQSQWRCLDEFYKESKNL